MENETPKSEETNQTQDSAKSMFRKGMDDAAEKAKEYAPKFKKEVDSIMSEMAYGAGFIPGFLGAFVKEFVPESLAEDLKKGLEKGQENAKQCADKMKSVTKPKEKESTDEEAIPF